MDILHQLGDLFLGSLPTMVLFLLLLFCYRVLVHGPLRQTLEERRERTAGAVERAHAAIALAEAKTQEYEGKLRAARLEIQGAREKQVAQWNAARDKAVGEVRATASAQVRAARAALEADVERSRGAMDGSINSLAFEILTAVLPAAARELILADEPAGVREVASLKPGPGYKQEVRS